MENAEREREKILGWIFIEKGVGFVSYIEIKSLYSTCFSNQTERSIQPINKL